MACTVDAVSSIRRTGDTTIRPIRTRRFLSGAAFAGAGIAVAMWCAFAGAVHSLSSTAPRGGDPFAELRLSNKVPYQNAAIAKERALHMAKAARLRPWQNDQDYALTSEDIRAYGLAHLKNPKDTIAKTARLDETTKPATAATVEVAAVAPATPAIVNAPSEAPTQASAATDRIVIPSKDEVAAREEKELLALAAVPALIAAPLAANPPVPTPRSGAPIRQAEVEVASVEEKTDAAASSGPDASSAFGLVLSGRDSDVPLPMSRPAAPSNAGGRGAPAALAYAKVENDEDDDNDDDVTPRIRKPTIAAGRGVAIYDISAGTVYLPSGERLEAHSGLGKMRDNPHYVDQKMRGPTPPHTYALTMREALFHGVEAIRLTPLGGAGAIHNRVGLLAHTYMLGARGDSNGCVSFKDYKRFLAAFKRGEIRQMVVVARMSDAPSFASSPASGGAKKTLASLLFSKS